MVHEGQTLEYTVYFAPFTRKDKNGHLSLRIQVCAETDRPFSEPHATNSVNRLYSFCTHAAETVAERCRSKAITEQRAEEIWIEISETLPAGVSALERPSLTSVLFDGSELEANRLERLLVGTAFSIPNEATRKSGSYGPVWSIHEAGPDTQYKSGTRPSGAEDHNSAPGWIWTFVVHSMDPTEFNASAETVAAPQEVEEQGSSSEYDGAGYLHISEVEDERELAIEHIRLTLERVQNAHAT